MRALLGAVICAAALSGVASATVAATPRVQVPETAPFTVHGTGFQPGERVNVSVILRGRHIRWVAVRASGTFTVAFPTVKARDCDSYLVRAVGTRGSKAMFKLPPPQCGPPPGGP